MFGTPADSRIWRHFELRISGTKFFIISTICRVFANKRANDEDL